eukprot:366525-Chlamydomonas_euryale.AAC.4
MLQLVGLQRGDRSACGANDTLARGAGGPGTGKLHLRRSCTCVAHVRFRWQQQDCCAPAIEHALFSFLMSLSLSSLSSLKATLSPLFLSFVCVPPYHILCNDGEPSRPRCPCVATRPHAAAYKEQHT